MILYRVCSAKYADLDGEGSRLYGGRWNSPGIAIVYTASTLALAILETRVHLRRMPVDYVKLSIEIPDAVFNPQVVTAGSLGPRWTLDTALTRRLGDVHFANTPMVPLKVPSVVVDAEWNILFSRNYAASHAMILENTPLSFDSRLWSV